MLLSITGRSDRAAITGVAVTQLEVLAKNGGRSARLSAPNERYFVTLGLADVKDGRIWITGKGKKVVRDYDQRLKACRMLRKDLRRWVLRGKLKFAVEPTEDGRLLYAEGVYNKEEVTVQVAFAGSQLHDIFVNTNTEGYGRLSTSIQDAKFLKRFAKIYDRVCVASSLMGD